MITETNKQCRECLNVKPLEVFRPGRNTCKSCVYQQAIASSNLRGGAAAIAKRQRQRLTPSEKARRAASVNLHHHVHVRECTERRKRWYHKTKPARSAWLAQYRSTLRTTSVEYRIRCALRHVPRRDDETVHRVFCRHSDYARLGWRSGDLWWVYSATVRICRAGEENA